jgi:uncharacterized membrane protein
MNEVSADGKQKRRQPNLFKWAIAALPVGILLGLIAGITFGNPAIGILVGAGLGIGGAAVLVAAAIVFTMIEK